MVSEELTTDCPVPIYQDAREMAQLLARVQQIQPKRILEVGSLYGGTLWHWMHFFPGATVVSVDAIAVGVPEHPKEKIAACRFEWPAWAAAYGCELHVVIGQSESEYAINEARQLAPFDFIFIDAGHKRDQITNDFNNYWPFLREGGLMGLHDCACRDKYPNIDVGTWWRELVATGQYNTELITYIPGWWGIGVITK